MELAQDGDQALFVDHALLGGEGFAAAEFVQHVVHAGQSEVGMGGLLAFAVGVELFSDSADYDRLLITQWCERERLKAASLVVANVPNICT